MSQSVVLLVTGAIAGGAAVYLLAYPDSESSAIVSGGAAALPPLISSTPEPSITVGATPSANHVSERIAVYEKAARATNPADLEAMIESAAVRSPSLSRDMELEVLLARLAELDPQRAVDLAHSLYLDTRFLEPLYQAWARVDVYAAIDAVALISSPANRRKLGLALLEVVGFTEQAVSLVTARMSDAEAASFKFDAIATRAESDPVGALAAALAIPNLTMQQRLILEIGRSAAGQSPLAALGWREMIDDASLRDYYTNRVLFAWAEQNPAAVFAYVESTDPAFLEMATGAFELLAESDPDRLLALAERLPTALARDARRAVLMTLAETDPVAALARADEWLPPGQNHESTVASIAQIYGRENPEAALSWARALEPPNQAALTAVLQGIAQVDFDRAVDAILADADRSEQTVGMPFGLALMFMMSPSGDSNFGRLANRLAGSDVPIARNMLANVLSRWANSDFDTALGWATANAERLDTSAFQSLAQQVARESPDLAIETLGRVPASQQQGWIEGVARGLAQTDIDRALNFLERYRGQPAFDNAVTTVVMLAAMADPVRASRLVETLTDSPRAMSAASMVASQWAAQDPQAAIAWAQTLDDEQARGNSLQTIAGTWAQSDADAARSWLLRMPSGATRDSAIDGFLMTAATTGGLDSQLLDAYSSDEKRQAGARNAIIRIGRYDLDEARRLLDLHISDPAIRRQTEEQLARTGGAGNGGLISGSGGFSIFN